MRYILGLVLVALLVGCGGLPGAVSCQEQIKPYAAQVSPIVTEWQDAITLASSTSRANLSPQIANLQAIRRKADAVTPPDCAKSTHAQLVRGMDLGIRGFLDFLTQKPQTTVDQEFTDAAAAIGAFSTQLNNLSNGTPTP